MNRTVKSVRGWAVARLCSDGDMIIVATVSEHRRAAAVNWLVLDGIMVTSAWTDDQIMRAFQGRRVGRVCLIEVDIASRLGATPLATRDEQMGGDDGT